ncbi:phage tail tape measure protein [Providencia rettgeri]|nr:phage tail tape measure protein [Providencia rettgeri]EJD6643061.1 phage tail tape measure protein [Providencia rettgeri]ELL9155525.1 phage tail tape measure protein [Providencia rettgeri]ELR5048817.1 phage tail tape measure protein [Providencia rettgeri]ELR5063708.1 phage tail tape measure protein [Providencia rettgeri]
MAEQTSRLAIILDSTGAKRNSDTLATSLERLTVQGEKAAGSTDELGFSFKRLATSAAGALSIGIVIKTVDEWGQVAARMKNALKSVEGDIKNYTTIQERFLAISNRNGKDIADTQLLYIGAATAMQELGYSTTQTVDYIESLSSAMTANASSVNEVLSMQNALNKAMVAGKVAGENWNSIMNATPTLLGDIAKQLEKQNGGMKVTEMEVKKLASEGKISFKLFADAVMAAKDANNALADSMDNTVADGLTRVTNSAKAYYGELNQSLGITRAISASLATVSDNFGSVSTVLTGIVGIGAARYFGNLANSIYDSTKKSAENALVSRKLAVDKVNVAKATLTQAQTDKAAALSSIAATKAQQTAATTEVQRISLKTQLANQTAMLTAATKAETVATTELAAAQGRLSLANNLLKGGLALVGGPVGLAMLAAGGMYAFSASMQQAKDDAVELSRGLDGLIAKLREMTREQKQIKVDELNKSLKSLNSVKFDAYSETSSTRRDLAKAEEALSKLKEGTDKYAKALDKVNIARSAVAAADAKYLQARDDESRAINTAKLIQADLNGTLQQGADLLRAHTQTTLPNGSAAFKSFGFDVGVAANALGRFNAASLQLTFTDGGAKLKKQLERDIALAKKTGEARERLRAQYAAEDAGETKPENIKVLEDAAAELYNLNQANRELNKTSTYSESAAQKMLSSLKEQQMVLIQQRDTNSSLGSQQQALVKWEQQIADIKSKKTLTADQKSLLANAELITLEMKRNAEIEKTIQHREAEVKIASFHKQMMEEAEQAQKRYNHTIEMAGMGTLAQGRMQERFQIEAEFERKQADLQKQFQDKSTGMTKAMYDEETQFISSQLQARLAMLEDFHVKQDAMRGNWTLGVHMALQNYADNARNYSQQAEGFITNSLQNITDGAANALTDITTNSKNALEAIGDFFGDMTKSVIKDLIRIFIQAQITNAMTGLFGGGIMGSSQVKTFNAGLNGLNLTGMAHSGIDRVPKTGTWLLEEGERVMTQDTSARLDNVLDALTRSTSPDVFAMKHLHPANQTNNTTNNSNVNNNTKNNEPKVSINIGDLNFGDTKQQQPPSSQMSNGAVKREFQQMVENGVNTLLRNPASALSRTIKGN